MLQLKRQRSRLWDGESTTTASGSFAGIPELYIETSSEFSGVRNHVGQSRPAPCRPGVAASSGEHYFGPITPNSCRVLITGINNIAAGDHNNIITKILEQRFTAHLGSAHVVILTVPLRHYLLADHLVNRQTALVNFFIEELWEPDKGQTGDLRGQPPAAPSSASCEAPSPTPGSASCESSSPAPVLPPVSRPRLPLALPSVCRPRLLLALPPVIRPRLPLVLPPVSRPRLPLALPPVCHCRLLPGRRFVGPTFSCSIPDTSRAHHAPTRKLRGSGDQRTAALATTLNLIRAAEINTAKNRWAVNHSCDDFIQEQDILNMPSACELMESQKSPNVIERNPSIWKFQTTTNLSQESILYVLQPSCKSNLIRLHKYTQIATKSRVTNWEHMLFTEVRF
ncbi:hypothetical protein J6590_041138 [Homalodisca vitripennis]|nr:hypothetical protein J6590_041138 [Homalodisca vitripennis]